MRKKNQINFEKNFIHGTESSNVTESSEVEADYKDEPHFKADFVLVYKELKGDKISLEDSMNDTEFSRKKKRLIFLENLVRYGLDIKRVIFFINIYKFIRLRRLFHTKNMLYAYK